MFRIFRVLVAILLLGALGQTAHAQIAIPNTLTAGTTIRAAELNTNFSTLGNHALDRLSGGNITGNITLDPGITIDGVDLGTVICPTCTPSFKDLVLVASATGVTVAGVNIINLNGKIPAISSVYFDDLSGANLTSLNATNVTSGTVNPARLGSGSATSSTYLAGDNSWQALNTVPAGAILYRDATTATGCWSGWTEYTAARGLYVVGLQNAGTKATAVGSALTNLENRPTGQHSHAITDVAHSHGMAANGSLWDSTTGDHYGGGEAGAGQYGGSIASAFTGITGTNNAGSVAGTNAPYLQLLVCVKS